MPSDQHPAQIVAITPTNRLLTAAEFHLLADVPPEVEWFANLSSGVAEPLKPVAQQGEGSVSEAYIQALVHEHPACLPIVEIDAIFLGPVPICTELNTPAGGVGA